MFKVNTIIPYFPNGTTFHIKTNVTLALGMEFAPMSKIFFLLAPIFTFVTICIASKKTKNKLEFRISNTTYIKN